MDYIQHKLLKLIAKTKKKYGEKYSTIVGYYNVLIQYQLYVLFACIWDKREIELTQSKRMDYLFKMKRASLGTILDVIVDLDSMDENIIGVNNEFREKITEFINLRNTETAHGILIPGVQEDSYEKLAERYDNIYESIKKTDIPIITQDCKIYYMPNNSSYQVTVFDNEDYDYQYFNEQLVKTLDIQPEELYYFFNGVCYKISPFLILKELRNREEPYEIYCYQGYNLRNGKFNYKRYSDLNDNISFSKICKDYFMSFQEEFSHTISKANGVICNKFENNYDYFIYTSPIDSYEQKVWRFINDGKSNACLTIRGGGGIGKTALVQYVCTKNIFEQVGIGYIQFVIFCSAKDREFKQKSGITGHIRAIKDEGIVRSYKEIIQIIAWVLDYNIDIKTETDIKSVEDVLVNTSGVLIIIDDFETLSEIDKKKVVGLSVRLDVMKHKMIITTRSQYMVGEECYIAGLNQTQTISFMKERFKQGFTEVQSNSFENFVNDNDIKNKIYELTKGLPMLAIQLGNMLILNGFNEESLRKREDEEVEEFLLGRLYSYFGTKTSKILFLIIAKLFQYGNGEILHISLKAIYELICERLNVFNIDYKQDLDELKKLNIIIVESDYIRVSNYISIRIMRQCQDELIESESTYSNVFDDILFKNIVDFGIRDGILLYLKKEDVDIDYSFVKIFSFCNSVKFTDDIRFDIIEKHVLGIIDNKDRLRDLYFEACKFFDIGILESKFFSYSKKYGFAVFELENKGGGGDDQEEKGVESFLQEIIDELEVQIDEIDDFIFARNNGASKGFCRDTIQSIRGKLGIICNVKLAEIFSLQSEPNITKLQQIKNNIDEISYIKEFKSIKDNRYYIRLKTFLKQ